MVTTAKSIEIMKDHVVIKENRYEYRYALNAKGDICQYTFFDSESLPLPKSIYDQTITKARKIINIFDKYPNLNINTYEELGIDDSRVVTDSLLDVIALNDFEFWKHLEQIYLTGNREIAKYYPFFYISIP